MLAGIPGIDVPTPSVAHNYPTVLRSKIDLATTNTNLRN